jgi:nicotinamidase-related amidase
MNTRLPDRLQPERCALVVIDIQDKFQDLIHAMDMVQAGTTRLVKFCQTLEIPVLVTEHYSKGLGTTIQPIQDLFSPHAPIEKIHFSCGGSDEFNAALAKTGRDQIILCGIETHVCVYQTACDLLREGKQVVVPQDAVSSCAAENRELGLSCLQEIGAQVMGVQMVMFEILRKAGTPRFKEVAHLLRD